ncbi:hypothetical protein A3C21_04025 [Candidatus Kaiserbacteria bacterium RIFCSPHIGHO2_02_FULL_59_21]|uniref:Shikimate kinase n=2 Tax=Candidatus Kaiseribacteriota TaxID=1752734 RepID=A0A0G1YVC5_9BACT|nr:MAG: hypothetical protein UY98_C0021G0009 [Candidatus Kaiserbacteria bacterium GW2011_GWA2_58_9]OGG61347.1 MAG: hypothetical protein A2766_01400 [Candidatus Kaiserbacteria bacterium RIFCSPHIGHO2_01_FULL_58_22]OGG66821.1 MAG: hypothetical protein A3C21_04025 [Candidatus Kaiserbacteria bacterium RIFCSPHIGHO2_02_FULL_59_21]OGG80760.1 MAG: hypothetical protein A2952_00620 [Candidatus Kaiserbacteria bacterium RIFCSPLOWO2_01_FULL_59_34]OGG86345.1 MAG: hypothetical protein A3I47_01275 [Candidatus K
MRTTQEAFDRLLAKQKLVLTFIGMSGIGKTRHARRLALLGFQHISCDDLIAPRISNMLQNVTDVGVWMGQPYSKRYRERERRFLELEEEVTREALLQVEGNAVIDTTGSVIYLSESLLQQLKENSLVVYFKAVPEMYERMLKVYLSDPKPVVWGDSFRRKKGENEATALKRSYPDLLEFRAKRYQELADVTIPFETRQETSLEAERLLRNIRASIAR